MSPDVSSSSEFRVLDGRLVLYDVGCLEALSEALRGAFPGSSFWLEPPWEFEVCVGEDRGIPVWYWSDSVERFVRDAPGLLRSFVYPLVASGLRFVLAFPFPAAALRRGRLDLDSLERLDVEDIGALLTDDGVSSTLDGLAALDGRLVMTPIEELLAVALSRADVRAQPQVRFGRYRPDFLVESSGRRIAIEADGRQFHDRERDRQRDQG